MKFTHPILRRAAGFAVASFARSWMSTLDFQAAYYDESVDPAKTSFHGPIVYAFWHENILAPFYLRGHCNFAMLLSRHRDADWLASAADFMGFESVRGSSFRGGSAALRELTRKVIDHGTNIAITPDGPRGPRRQLAQGPVFLASKLGVPLVVFGIGYDRPWRMPTWDRFALPRPYTRCRAIMSPRMHIPANLDREGIEHYRQRAETLLNCLTQEAEAWAATPGGKYLQHSASPSPSNFAPRELVALSLAKPLPSRLAITSHSTLPSDVASAKAA